MIESSEGLSLQGPPQFLRQGTGNFTKDEAEAAACVLVARRL
jgi:hypothetical protein